MDVQDLISRLAVALGIGLLIGLERGWRTREARPGSRAAGIAPLRSRSARRHGRGFGDGLGGAVHAPACRRHRRRHGVCHLRGVIALFTRAESAAAGDISATTAIAGMLTFALSAYALLGDMRIAAGAAVAVAGLLALPRAAPPLGAQASPGRNCGRHWCCSR